MTSRYTVNYHLTAHKRDAFIEFIKSLLRTPFVLHSRPEIENLNVGSQSLTSFSDKETNFTTNGAAMGIGGVVNESVDKNVARCIF